MGPFHPAGWAGSIGLSKKETVRSRERGFEATHKLDGHQEGKETSGEGFWAGRYREEAWIAS